MGTHGRQVPMGTHGRRVPMGTQGYYPKKSMGMGWVGFVSEFNGYFRVGYPKRLLILGTFGYQTRGLNPRSITYICTSAYSEFRIYTDSLWVSNDYILSFQLEIT